MASDQLVSVGVRGRYERLLLAGINLAFGLVLVGADYAMRGQVSVMAVVIVGGVVAWAYLVAWRWAVDQRSLSAALAASICYLLFSALLWQRVVESVGSALVGLLALQALTLVAWHYRKQLRHAPLTAQFGLVIVAAYVMIAALAPILAPYGESQVVGTQYEAWSSAHILGTDNIGRDMLSRLIFGARNTISIAIVATALGFLMGSAIGLLAATLGGWIDNLFGRLVDILMAIPQLIFALLILTIVGTSIASLVIVIAVVDATRVFRLVRAVSMNVLAFEYVEAARLRGESTYWIMRKEVLPNILGPLAVEFGVRFCFVFLFISSLSFLGLGIQPPLADWGSMVRDNAALIAYGDVTPLLPAAAIALLAVAVNLIVDWFLQHSSGLKE